LKLETKTAEDSEDADKILNSKTGRDIGYTFGRNNASLPNKKLYPNSPASTASSAVFI
jgi:hypothetical protein